MKAAPKPRNEEARLRRLRHYRILNSAPEQDFQDIVALASLICQTPIAIISLVDSDRQWFKARIGIEAVETSRDVSFCSHTILGEEVFTVENALTDERFADNPLVLGSPGVGFYAGAPLLTPDGLALGALCVVDHSPRKLDEQQIQSLQLLAKFVMRLMDVRLINQDLRDASSDLRKSEQRFRFVTENLSDAIVSLDEKGLIAFATPVITKILGYTPEELIGQPYGFLLSEDMREERTRQLQHYLATGERSLDWRSMILTGRRKDGSTVPIEITANDYLVEGRKVITGVIRDVSARLEAERLIRESEDRFHEITAHIHEVFWMKNMATGLMEYVSPACEKMFGHPAASFIKDPHLIEKVIVPEDVHLLQQLDAATNRQEVSAEYRILHPDGTIRFVIDSSYPIFDKLGNVVRICGVARDVTEKRRAELEAEFSRAAMVQSSKMSALGEMSAGVAHEINNPLSIILGKAELLKEMVNAGNLDPAKVRTIAEKIETTSERIAKIIKSLLFFSRDGSQAPFQSVKVRDLVDDITALCGERFQKHAIQLQVMPIPADATVECRPVEFSQVLLNLLNNAHDAVLGLPEKWILMEFREGPYGAEFSITDSGKGIPSGIREKIFEPFYTTKEIGKGTGIGLSLSRGIVENHGGRIYVDEHIANTTFVVRIPRKQTEAA